MVRPTGEPVLHRKVVMVTTHDRLMIPPIQQFCELVRQQAGNYFNRIDELVLDTESQPQPFASVNAGMKMPEYNRLFSEIHS